MNSYVVLYKLSIEKLELCFCLLIGCWFKILGDFQKNKRNSIHYSLQLLFPLIGNILDKLCQLSKVLVDLQNRSPKSHLLGSSLVKSSNEKESAEHLHSP